jgi:hypothetical protein
VASGAWEELAGLERGLQSAALVAHEGTLIRVGGLYAQHSPEDAADAGDRLRSTSEVARYDIASGRWTSLPPLPTPRSSHMAAVLDHVLYVAGGWDLDHDPATARWATTVEALDLRNTDMPAGAPSRRRSSCAAWAWPRPAGSWWWWAAWTPSACRSE